MHAGYSDVAAGDRHIAGVIDTLRRAPRWSRMLVIVTFDENCGWSDHIAPPKDDRWGPGTRIPALIVSAHAHPGFTMREKAMVAAGGAPPGDLTHALQL